MLAWVRWAFWRAYAEVYSVFAGSKAAIHYRRRAGGILAAHNRKRGARSALTPASQEGN